MIELDDDDFYSRFHPGRNANGGRILIHDPQFDLYFKCVFRDWLGREITRIIPVSRDLLGR